MITSRITFKFRKDVCKKKYLKLLCFLNDIQISIEKGANSNLFHLSESDHKSETTMMTHQMGLIDRGKSGLQSKLCMAIQIYGTQYIDVNHTAALSFSYLHLTDCDCCGWLITNRNVSFEPNNG